MNDIKAYEPIIIVYFKDIDGQIDTVITSKKNKKAITDAWNKDKCIEIEWEVINTYLIQKISEPKDTDEEFFYSLPKSWRQEKIARRWASGAIEWMLSKLKSMPKENFLSVYCNNHEPIREKFTQEIERLNDKPGKTKRV